MTEIDFALVEDKRPPLYTAMKYWGKKPHNIWRKYIENYTPDNGLYLDPFAGSAMSAFEAVKAGKKGIAFDLNPLTSFLIEAFCSNFNKKAFKKIANEIIGKIERDDIYLKYFSTKCATCKKKAIVKNFKWNERTLYELGIVCFNCNEKNLQKPTPEDENKSKKMKDIQINYWHPKEKFYDSPSFSANFISCIGGNYFYNLWTKRNLYIISKLFNLILKVEDNDLKKQLLLGFIKTIHLCTKMCVPRRGEANRAFSTSWGRSAYICAARQMEMNPLHVFSGSCFGKQSVESSISSVKSYVGKIPKILYVDKSNKKKKSRAFDIKYGIVDINTITDFVEEESIDFILTDPPYGGLVPYLDLSTLWLIWLKKVDRKYTPNYLNEITIKNQNSAKDIDRYSRMFQNGVKNLYKLLKKDGKIVFTFHNKKINEWNAFLKAIRFSKLKIEKVIHQQNRRTGESNVANPYGTSAADFYIRCIKDKKKITIKTKQQEFEDMVIENAKMLIAQRNEPTPYQILFNGILAEISLAGFDIKDFDTNIKKILTNKVGIIFKITKNENNKAGKYWWFTDPSKHIKYPDRDLNDRVEHTVLSFLKQNQSIHFDSMLAEIFIKYPNGLIPNVQSITKALEKYAYRSGSMWHYKGFEIDQLFTEHTKNLVFLSLIGKKMGFKIYIGKNEQSYSYNSKKLSEYADIMNLKNFDYKLEQRKRIEMIDMLWIKDHTVKYAIEVENSTKFTSGLQRASNLNNTLKKIMVIPDKREKELLKTKDPMFIKAFNEYNWSYLLYKDILRLTKTKKIDKNVLFTFLNGV